jgi:hypothetical protein
MTLPATSLRWGVLALVVFGPAGCERTPRAPALTNGPVYQSTREGFRFLVPDGWTQAAHGEMPPAPVTEERMLVEYRLVGDQPVALRVTAFDLPESEDLVACLNQQLPEGGTWKLSAGPQSCEAGGAAGIHLAFTGREGGQETTREIRAFRRGGRVYLFTGVFAATDTKARLEIRRAVESLSWQR